MDIRRAALDSISQSQSYHSSVRQYNRQAPRSTLSRSRSHPRLDLGDYPTSVVAPPIGPTYASTVLVSDYFPCNILAINLFNVIYVKNIQ